MTLSGWGWKEWFNKDFVELVERIMAAESFDYVGAVKNLEKGGDETA